MKYYIIAGEASGDLHGGNLVTELRKSDPAAQIRGWGGEKMRAAGVEIIKDYRELAFMGFAEVIKNLPAIIRNISFCKKDIAAFKPDVLVLIDYPGFNMRIAKWAHGKKIKVAWYISPQLWAWKENRVHALKRDVDKMLVILPFEKDFYSRFNVEAIYTGHPLVQHINDWNAAHPKIGKQNLVALLPGSRRQEISIKLPIMLKVIDDFPAFNFCVAKAPGIPDEFYDEMLSAYKNVKTVTDQTYLLLARASAALVTSGTATLETALFGVPQIICYKGSKISYEIAKRVIKIKFIGLVNLIMDREVVTELIQDELTVDNLVKGLRELLHNNKRTEKLDEDYAALRELLGAGGNASEKAAAEIYSLARNRGVLN